MLTRIAPVTDRTAHSDGRVCLYLGPAWSGMRLIPVFHDLEAGLMLLVMGTQLPTVQRTGNLHGVIENPKKVDPHGRLWWKNGVKELGLRRGRLATIRTFGVWVLVELGDEFGPVFQQKQPSLFTGTGTVVPWYETGTGNPFTVPDLHEADRSDTRDQLELPLKVNHG